MQKSKWDLALRTLSVASFLVAGWVLHRSLSARENCVDSRILAYVRWTGGAHSHRLAESCRFQSRLGWFQPAERLDEEQRQDLRRLERAEATAAWLHVGDPSLSLEIVEGRAFALQKQALRLGRAWLSEPLQLARALSMTEIRTAQWRSFGSQYQLEIAADFMHLALGGPQTWIQGGRRFNFANDARFPTVAKNFALYCRSPFRSLAHTRACETKLADPAEDLFGRVWGLRAALTAGLYRAYTHLSLAEKLNVLAKLRAGVSWPILTTLPKTNARDLAVWFADALTREADALGVTGADGLALRRALVELDVEAPTHWELTVDLTHTPAWREILEQFRAWTGLRRTQRTLLFTPEGQIALPSGIAVAWPSEEIRSQKHLLIACGFWPNPRAAVSVHARETFAERSCTKLQDAFWD